MKERKLSAAVNLRTLRRNRPTITSVPLYECFSHDEFGQFTRQVTQGSTVVLHLALAMPAIPYNPAPLQNGIRGYFGARNELVRTRCRRGHCGLIRREECDPGL